MRQAFNIGDIIRYTLEADRNSGQPYYGFVTRVRKTPATIRDGYNIRTYYDVVWFDGANGTSYSENDIEAWSHE
jgi:hypothetical protein